MYARRMDTYERQNWVERRCEIRSQAISFMIGLYMAGAVDDRQYRTLCDIFIHD